MNGRVWRAKVTPASTLQRRDEEEEDFAHDIALSTSEEDESPCKLTSESDTRPPAEADAYREALGLVNSSPSRLTLPLAEQPHLSARQLAALSAWAAKAQRTTLPSGLYNVLAVEISQVPFHLLGCLSAEGCALLASGLGDLQSKMEELNVHWLRGGFAAGRAVELLRGLELAFTEPGGSVRSKLAVAEAASMAELGVGLDGLCRAVAEHARVLGPGGSHRLRRGRRALREWLQSLDDVDFNNFDFQEGFLQVGRRLADEDGADADAMQLLCAMSVASYQAVRGDLCRHARGDAGEDKLASKLHEAGVLDDAFVLEAVQRDIQTTLFGKMAFGTPDILFRTGFVVNGTSEVHWIDSKGSCLLPGFAFASQVKRIRRQLEKYVELFGPGLVIWQGPFAEAATAGLAGVRCAAWARASPTSQAESPFRWQ